MQVRFLLVHHALHILVLLQRAAPLMEKSSGLAVHRVPCKPYMFSLFNESNSARASASFNELSPLRYLVAGVKFTLLHSSFIEKTGWSVLVARTGVTNFRRLAFSSKVASFG